MFDLRTPTFALAIGLFVGCGRVDFNPAPDAEQSFDYCELVPSLAVDPVIDGVIEGGVAPIAIQPIWFGPGVVPSGVSARYAVGWRPDRLYVFLDVTDPDRWQAPAGDDEYCGDAVELYVDADGIYPSAPSYDIPGAAQLVVVAPADDVTALTRGERYQNRVDLGAWDSTAFRAYPRPGGYVVEAAVVAADLGLGSWTLSGHVGLDIVIDVSTPDGSAHACKGPGVRLGQMLLRIAVPSSTCTDGGPYCDPESFCTPTLH
jgi:Carbohydrate family 9 binding domain-like